MHRYGHDFLTTSTEGHCYSIIKSLLVESDALLCQ